MRTLSGRIWDRILALLERFLGRLLGIPKKIREEVKEEDKLQSLECTGVIPNTWIICGEGGNFCSDECLKHSFDVECDRMGAPYPSTEAFQKADKIALWANKNGLMITDMCPDILGGVSLWLASPKYHFRSVWVDCMNNGSTTIVTSMGIHVLEHAAWEAGGEALTRTFLSEEWVGSKKLQE